MKRIQEKLALRRRIDQECNQMFLVVPLLDYVGRAHFEVPALIVDPEDNTGLFLNQRNGCFD